MAIYQLKSNLKLLILITILFPIVSCNKKSIKMAMPFIDPRDGKEYQCKQIGNKTWMVENLAYNTNNSKSLFYNSDSVKYHKYGRLYFVEDIPEAINIDGWHLPDTSEWTQLIKHYGINKGNFGARENHEKCKEWEKEHLEAIETFLFDSSDGFNFQFGGLWHQKWLSPNVKNQRCFEFMGHNGTYWASPIDNKHLYTHISMGVLKYYWMEISSEKPSLTYKSGDDFRFSIRLVKD